MSSSSRATSSSELPDVKLLSRADRTGTTPIFTQADVPPVPDYKKEDRKLTEVPDGEQPNTRHAVFFPRRKVLDPETGEESILTFTEWKKFKNRAIADIIDLGFDDNKLKRIRYEVLGRPELTMWDKPVMNPGWWIVPAKSEKLTKRQKAENREWVLARKDYVLGLRDYPGDKPHLSAQEAYLKAITGKVPDSNNYSTSLSLVIAEWLPNADLKECKGSSALCFVAYVQEAVRTAYDLWRSMHAIHNILCAVAVNGNTRQAYWTALRRAWSLNSSTNDSVFGADIRTKFHALKVLVDPNLTKGRKFVGQERTREKQSHQLIIRLHDITDIIEKGRIAYAEEREGTWADKFVWLSLVSGARKIELFTLGRFLPVTEKDRKLNPSLFRSDIGLDRWVRQIGIAKKRTDAESETLAVYDEKEIGVASVVKPLLGQVTFKEFNTVVEDMRGYVWPHLERIEKGPPSTWIRKRVGNFRPDTLSKAFDKVWKRGRNTQYRDLTVHSLRAIYGNVSFHSFAPQNMSLTVWLATRLGHDVTDLETATHYQTISVSGLDQYVTPERLETVLQTLIEEARALMEELQAVKKRKVDEERVEQRVAVADTHITRLLPGGSRDERRVQEQKILEELKTAGIPPTANILRRIGFGYRKAREITR